MICEKCGNQVPEGSTFCQKCGTKLTDAAAVRQVPPVAQRIKFEGLGKLKIVSILLFVGGAIGILLGSMMFGDIGVSAYIGSVAAILSGFGFWQCHKALNNFGNRPHS